MRFRISHLLLLATIVAVAFTMRNAASSAANEGIISISVIVLSIAVTTTLHSMGATPLYSILGATLASALMLILHYLECLLKSPTTEYVWRNPYFSSDPEIYFASAMIVMIGCAIAASTTAFSLRFAFGVRQAEPNG